MPDKTPEQTVAEIRNAALEEAANLIIERSRHCTRDYQINARTFATMIQSLKTEAATPSPAAHNRNEDQIINDMADAMMRYGEGCTREQLEMHFTGAEIDQHSERARSLANDRTVRQTRARVPARRAA